MPNMDEPARTLPIMRLALLLGALLTFAAGVQLFVLTAWTDRYFAWTIVSGASATTLGAFYWTACVLSFLSWRRRHWADARVGVPGVTLFLWATLAATLAHIDRFHFGSGIASARFAAWAWLVIYIADPLLVSAALAWQLRAGGGAPPRGPTLGTPLRLWLGLGAVVFAILGAAMIAVPSQVAPLAPWSLTPLTSRAIGAWVVAMAGVFATMAWENDAARVRPAAVASLVLPVLLAIGLGRHAGELRAGASTAWVLGLMLYVAVTGIAAVRRAPR